jgi:DNA-binding Lrp family transcriptional regulator
MSNGVTAIINVFVETELLEKVTDSITKFPEVIDVYEVTGEFDLVAMVKADTILDFRRFLKDKIMKMQGIKSTVTSIILYAHKKDGKLISQ